MTQENNNPGPYTTITVASFNNLASTIGLLRMRLQTARECLEKGSVDEALEILKDD